MVIPTPRAAALVAAGAVVLAAWPGADWRTCVLVNGVLLVAVAVDAIRCISPATIRVSRELPGSMRVGDTAEVAWSIDNPGHRPVLATVTDTLWPSFGATRRSVTARLAPATRTRATAQLRPTRRGRFPLDTIAVRVAGPLGLVGRQASRVVAGSIKVMPAYPSQDAVRRRWRIPRVADTGLRTIRLTGGGTEFDQLRDFREGDEFRRIDWASTMRLQRPIVKQFQIERNQTVVVLLDNGRVMAGTVAGAPRVEHAMDAALAVAEATLHLGDRVGMVCFDREVRSIVPATSGRRHLGAVSEAMYLLEPDFGESAYLAAFSAAAARFRRRSLFVVLTDLSESTVEQTIRPALALLLRRHVVVVGCVRDPVIGEWARPTDIEWASDAYRQAAAIGNLDARDRAAARLRSTGAIVVDAEPGQLALCLVDTYLELKAAGRL